MDRKILLSSLNHQQDSFNDIFYFVIEILFFWIDVMV